MWEPIGFPFGSPYHVGADLTQITLKSEFTLSNVLGYFSVQAICAQLYGMIGGRRHVVECIRLL